MPQPNQGKPASSAPTAEPIHDKGGSKGKGDVHFGHMPGGTKGSK
jgi:hypothetical protein